MVDDEKDMCDTVADYLSKYNYEVDTAQTIRDALSYFRREDYDVVITDLRMRDGDGMDILRTVKVERPDVPVIIITAFGSIDTAVEATKAGAFNFVPKPFNMRMLEAQVAKAVEQRRLIEENRRLRHEVKDKYDTTQIIGHSKAMSEVFRLIDLVADSLSNVLIIGESGTGKELVARAIHYRGRRANAPFVPVNCSAIPEGLLESELFGHARGAFTGAYTARRGLFVEASGGTLFLDEIGDMSLALQAKLLRVIQDRVVRPIGSDKTFPVNTRIIAATHRDLLQEVKEGRFREDLYYRLSVIPIRIPPLSERIEDIPLLVDHFLKKYARETQTPLKRITPRAMDALQRRPWEGNVRELENIIERLVVLTRKDVIDIEDLPSIMPRTHDYGPWPPPGEMPTLKQLEFRYVQWVLEHVGGNKEKASKILGINRRTLYRMKDKWERTNQ